MRILGIDPGLNCTGLAWDLGGALPPTAASARPLSRGLRDKAREIVREIPDVCWDLLVIEKPQVYRDGKGDPNDLIDLAILAGGIISLVSTYNVLLVTPGTWKKQVPKKIHHQRIRARVPELAEGRYSLDAMDALGLLVYGQDLSSAQQKARRNRKPM